MPRLSERRHADYGAYCGTAWALPCQFLKPHGVVVTNRPPVANYRALTESGASKESAIAMMSTKFGGTRSDICSSGGTI